MPMSASFKDRLFPAAEDLAAHFGTPFHIYDEAGIRETGARLKQAFAGIDGFREYFAVKALPNPRILALMTQTKTTILACWTAAIRWMTMTTPTKPSPRKTPNYAPSQRARKRILIATSNRRKKSRLKNQQMKQQLMGLKFAFPITRTGKKRM